MNKEHTLANIQDEIDLACLAQALWKSKWVIILSTVLTTCVALIYSFFLKPTYEARILLITPISADLAAVNYGRNVVTRLKPMSPSDAFNLLRGVLFAQSTLDDFNSNEAQALNVSSQKTLPVINVKAESFGYAVVALAHSPEIAASAAQRYVDFTQKITLDKLNDVLNKEINVVKARVNEELNSMRTELNNQRASQLLHLQDALQLAEKLEITTPRVAVAQNDSRNTAYLRGSIALKAEIASLKKQQSEALLPPPLINLQHEYNGLNNINLNENDVALIRVDGKMVVSNKPIDLNIARIIFLSAFLGLILGVLFVIIHYIKKNIRTTQNI
ncbi:MAG: Wzz/FepE/Etk N-terminal domain-containing protein [Legionella sp.]|nr:Wzz/FepE/Etk N-terminal domain-containing protein [Legionella sp.]